MSTAVLTLTYREDSEGDGAIAATVKSGVFAGGASAAFDGRDVKQTFLPTLRQFPLAPSALPLLEGGIWSREKPRRVVECHLRLAVKPYDSKGALLVRVDLAAPAWPHARDVLSVLSVAFLSEYAAIANFADAFERVLDGTAERAALTGLAAERWL